MIRMSRVVLLALCGFSFVLVPACEKDGSSTGDTRSNDSDDPAGKAGSDAPKVKLISAGKEPRRALRFEIERGHSETMDIIMKMGMEMSMGGNAMPKVDLPPMKMTMSMHATEVAANGDVRVEVKLTDTDVVAEPGAIPAVVDAMKRELAKMNGMTGFTVINKRGFVLDGRFQAPPDAPAQVAQLLSSMEDSMRQLTVPMPEEPIGVGGSWQVKQRPVINGIAIAQTGTYKVTKLDDKEVTFEVKLVQEGKKQTVEMPTVPGIKTEIKSWKGSGSGTIQLVRGRLAPTQSHAVTDSSTSMKVLTDPPQSIDARYTFDFQIRSTKSE